MSYEGYEIYLCVNGHKNVADAHDYEGYEECPDCDGAMAWVCSVDQTNDSGVAPVLVEHEPAQTETCECCGHTRELAPETYAIPSNAGQLLEAADDRTVPVVNVKFRDLVDGKEYETEEAAWAAQGYV